MRHREARGPDLGRGEDVGAPSALPRRHPDGDTSHGVLVVEVPPSPLAPHMVDDSYWGRSSNGKRKLADPEVRRLMESRTGSYAAFRQRLVAIVDDDPVGQRVEGHPTGNGHIFLLAEPCALVLGRAQDFDLAAVVRSSVGSANGDVIGALSDRASDRRGPVMSYPAAPDPTTRRRGKPCWTTSSTRSSWACRR